MNDFLFTSESVCEGHPDKIADSISDTILDEVLRHDPYGRVAVETLVTEDRVWIAGELTTNANIDYEKVVRRRIRNLGYTDDRFRFTDRSPIEVYIHKQSPEIARGVRAKGAGDQGMMFGFACRDWRNLMPMPITIAHALAQRVDEVRKKKILSYLRPDGKTQVTIEYKNGKPYTVRHLVLAVPHSEKIKHAQVKSDLYKNVVKPVLGRFGFSIAPKDVVVNGTGLWHIGGPASDTGLTGRKIIVDTYGGFARIGGGCFSGKDATKVDRSAAYAARFIAKNIVAHKLADKVDVRLAYFIGAKKPVMREIETFGTARKAEKVIRDFTTKLIDTSVEGIIKKLKLRRPIFLKTSTYGHFGRSEFSWEKIIR